MARIMQIQIRRGTAAAWTSANPVLAAGEMGFESDTGQFKIGDGSAAWSALSYASITTAAGDTRYILASTKGAANGVASLDGTGKLTAAQMPSTLRIANVGTVANQAARLALAVDDDAQFIVQSDTSQTFMLAGGADPSVNGNWIALPQPGTAGLQPTSEKDAANGYAGLDGTGKLKTAEFPVLDGGTP